MTRLKQHNKNIKVYRKNAFTLVEVMVGIILTTIVLSAAYMIWSRVQIRISRSYTKQTLQNELRKVANHMQNDFKSIKFYKDDSDEKEKAVKITGSDNNFKMTFQKFKELKDNDNSTLAQDSVESVEYSLSNNVLMRVCDRKTKVLTHHCEGITIKPAGDSEEYKNAKQEVKEAKEAQLDIEISGKMIVPGSGEEMYHIEKTSVVMRNEYYNKINKNYKSNFDLAKIDSNKIVGEGASSLLSGENVDYKELNTDVLENLKESEQEVLDSLTDSLKDIDDTIKSTKPEDVPWYKKLFSNLSEIFAGKEDDYALFKKSRDALEKADSVDACEKAIKDLKAKIDDQEKNFYKDSYKKDFGSLTTEKQMSTFKRAYDMAVQQKSIDDAYKELGDESAEKPVSNIDLQQKIVDSPDYTEAQKEEAREIIAMYKDIDLSWMDNSDKKSEVGIYKANKQLMDQANTKLELLRSKEKTQQTITEIQGELDSRS